MSQQFKNSAEMFGEQQRRLLVSKQKQEGYKLWWEFLRRNEDYKDHCRNLLRGDTEETIEVNPDCARIYYDFGNVFRFANFREWWESENARRIFGDEPLDLYVKEIKTPFDWDWHSDPNLGIVLLLPFNHSKRDLIKKLSKILTERHPGKPGRKSGKYMEASTAKYKFHRTFSVKTLKNQLAVYDAVKSNRHVEHKRTQAEIGRDLKLVRAAMPDPKDPADIAAEKRAVMAASVSRLYRQAERIIKNTIKGQFPNSKD